MADPLVPSEAGPRSILRVIRVLTLLADEVDGLSLTELSERSETPKSSMLAIMKALCDYGYAQLTGRRYILGPEAYRLSDRINFDKRAADIGDRHLARLVARVSETAILAVHDRRSHEALYIAKCESPHPVRYTVPVGTKRPLYCTSAGRVILARADDAYLEEYLARLDPKTFTDKTVTDVAQLRRIIASVRSTGYVINLEELLDGIYGVAVPVLLTDGRFFGAIAVAVPYNRASEVQQGILEEMQRTARELGEHLSVGYRALH